MLKAIRNTACAGLLVLAAGLAAQSAFAEDPQGDPSPFPPGPNAMLVKQTCSACHTPNVVLNQTFNEKTARKIYQKMLGESPDTERGKKIVEYLSTVMGEKDDK
jgi:mono/diheme cytochrome c family protein